MADQTFPVEAEEAGHVISEILPDPTDRRVVLKQLIASAEYAETVAPNAWAVTLYKNIFRMNVGRVEALVAGSTFVRINCVGTVGVAPFTGPHFEHPDYRSVPDPKCAFVGPIDRFAAIKASLQPHHRKFIDVVGRRKSGEPVSGSSLRKSHCEGLIVYARAYVASPERGVDIEAHWTADDKAILDDTLVIAADRGLSAAPVFLATLESAFNVSLKKALADSPSTRQSRLRDAAKMPVKVRAVTEIYLRNADVVAEVLIRAFGVCERCLKPAPFMRKKDGTAYLEIHHKKQLASGGEDTVENAMALCANCHRELHYGAERT